jgi:hypothetical protein
MSDTNQDRKKAVREAWKSERAYVREGKGTRDWAKSEQREIVAKGRAKGYEGHHMKSVKEYPQYAGNPQNIQFLSRSEHVNGAHKGNTQNATNGYYNPATGTTHSFGNRNPVVAKSQNLSAPLTQRQQDLAIKSEQARQQAAKQAKVEKKQAVTKIMPNNTQTPVTPSNRAATNKGIDSMRNHVAKAHKAASPSSAKPNHNKGIDTARQKAAMKQSGTNTGQSSNQGIKSHQNKTSGQSVSKSSTSGGKSGDSSSKGQSSGSGKGR